jgi:hypothetical protein
MSGFDEWLQEGIEKEYLFHACLMHDLPTTEAEDQDYEDGLDPCFHRYLVKPELLE